MTDTLVATSELVIADDPVALARQLAEQGRADGLPVVPATPDRVDAMLAASPLPADEPLGFLPPAFGVVTPRYVAINAVLAGCSPEHLPVLLAASDALMAPEFNLYGISPTTNPVAPLLVVHGPAVRSLRLNDGVGCFGPGNYGNAVLGRAVRFIVANLGGALPGETDHATHGWPGKYTFCAAENTDATPWEPFHARRGLAAGDSAVTVFGIQAQHNIIDITSVDGFETLRVVGAGMAAVATNNHTLGGEALVVISPEQAERVSGSDLDYDTACRILFEHARIDMTGYPESFRTLIRGRRPRWCDLSRVPIVDRHEDIQILVMGGPGIHALYLPSFGSTVAVTRPVGGRP